MNIKSSEVDHSINARNTVVNYSYTKIYVNNSHQDTHIRTPKKTEGILNNFITTFRNVDIPLQSAAMDQARGQNNAE